MDEGVYERLLTNDLLTKLDGSALKSDIAKVDKADQAHVLARHVGDAVFQHLSAISEQGAQLDAANRLLNLLDAADESVAAPARQLLRLFQPSSPGAADRTKVRPSTPLSDVALLTNASGEPSIGHELPAEISSADRVDLVCAFIRWSGVRLLERELTALADAGKPFRVITTTYLGSTERATLDRLVNEYGAQVCVQYDALRTRLHAKAWLFQRDSGYDTAYIGSSNLSNAALLDGVEWNVRLSRISTPSLIDKFQSTFETYWNEDPSFERYDPDRDRDRLDDALAEASGTRSNGRSTLTISGLEVRPYLYQQMMLDEIRAERDVHDRHRNLVVAATGTGKTVLAALDFRNLVRATGEGLRLLFVAHRQEILEQARRTYREVLADANFGELYVSGARPERWNHVFASIQSLASYGIANIPADHFDVVVIDEFHHGAAPTYRAATDHLEPRELLGLTATPERADGINVREYFGSRIATQLRLWDALEAELLCPFHYFGIADGVDLSRLTWKRGRYEPAELDNLYTGNDARAEIILRSIAKQIVDPRSMRALGFCVSVQHAEYMAKTFTAAGIPAVVVDGKTSDADRVRAISDLKDKSVNAIFSVDVFNEGLDIPVVDTILMLRPTESITVFLQQLGRGLRFAEGKYVLTVFDFVGAQREEFRWDLRFRAISGRSRSSISSDVEQNFPTLPSGCRIVLDEETQRTVLTSIKRQMRVRWPEIVAEARSLPDVSLSEFLNDTGIPLSLLTKRERSWTSLKRDAGILTDSGSELESHILARNRSFAHVNDPVRVLGYRRLLHQDSRYTDMSGSEQRLAEMLVFTVWPNGGEFSTVDEALSALRSESEARDEILSITDLTFNQSRQNTFGLPDRPELASLYVHAKYQREEILAALGEASFESLPSNFREGVKYVKHLNVDAFFVTLVKSEKAYSPTTMYRDYPISRSLFHWESQSTTRPASPTGQRYIHGNSTVLLFVRTHSAGEHGVNPYTFLGPAAISDYQGDRPISIVWKLQHEMPAELFNEGKVTAS